MGGAEILLKEHLEILKHLEEVNNWLRPHFGGDDVFEVRDEMVSEYGFGEEAKVVVFNKFEGSLNTGKYVYELTKIV